MTAPDEAVPVGWFIIGPEGQVAGFRKNCPHDYPHKVRAYRLRLEEDDREAVHPADQRHYSRRSVR